MRANEVFGLILETLCGVSLLTTLAEKRRNSTLADNACQEIYQLEAK